MRRNKIYYPLVITLSVALAAGCGKTTVTEVSPSLDATIVDTTNESTEELSDESLTEASIATETEVLEIEGTSEKDDYVDVTDEKETLDNKEEKDEADKVDEIIEELPENVTEQKTEEEAEEEDLEEEPKEEIIIPASFDATFYANNNPDVVAAFGNTPEALYNHYLNYGKKEGRAQNAQEQEAKNQAAAATPAPTNNEPAPQSNPAPSSTPSSSTSEGKRYEVYLDTEMFNMINAYRAECGLPALTWNSGAEQIAQDRIVAIAQGGVLSHDAAGGPPAGYCAENLFNGTDGTAEFIFNGYKNSPGHDANLKCGATSCVVATVRVKEYAFGLDILRGVWNIHIFY